MSGPEQLGNQSGVRISFIGMDRGFGRLPDLWNSDFRIPLNRRSSSMTFWRHWDGQIGPSAWLLDTDYKGLRFYVSQVSFARGSAWQTAAAAEFQARPPFEMNRG